MKKDTINFQQNKNYKLHNIIGIFICLLIVIAVFAPTINRPWLFYDESSIYTGAHFPTPKTFTEIFEIIQNFGLNFNLVSSNYIYSSNHTTRTCPLTALMWLITNFILKSNPILFHILCISLHLINTCLVYFILSYCLITNNPISKSNAKFYLFLLITFTTLWATHPVILESVLLSTNFGATLSYIYFLSLLLDFLVNRKKNITSILRKILIPFIFLIPMVTNEYIVALPLVLLICSFYYNRLENSFIKALKITIKETAPYLCGLVLYVIYFFLFTSSGSNKQVIDSNYFFSLLQRIFWLSPQIFFHFLKLVLSPTKLSIDQTLFVKLGNYISDPYAIFCIMFTAIWLFIPLYFFTIKKKLSNLFLLTWAFFIALLPFLHILAPLYSLAQERYLYTPFAVFIFGIANIIVQMNRKYTFSSINKGFVSAVISIVFIFCLSRSYIRTQDWKSNEAFINSTYKASNNALFEGLRLGMLGKILSVTEPQKTEEIKDYFNKSSPYLEVAKKEIEEKKLTLQDKLPSIIKTYGLDYDSLLKKILYLQASTIYLDLKGDHKEALSILESNKTIPLDPPYAELYSHLLIEDKNLKNAEDILLKAYSQYPKSDTLIKKLIDFYMFTSKDSTKAEKYLQDALKLFLYNPNILLKAIAFYQEQNNLILTAKYAYLHALRTSSKSTYQIALSNFLASGNERGAKKVISKLFTLYPNDPETLYFVSKYYYQLKDYQKALSFLTEAYNQTKRPNISKILAFDITHNLAKLYLFLGNKDTAAKLSTEAFNLAESKESFKELASFYKTLGLNKEMELCISRFRTAKS